MRWLKNLWSGTRSTIHEILVLDDNLETDGTNHLICRPLLVTWSRKITWPPLSGSLASFSRLWLLFAKFCNHYLALDHSEPFISETNKTLNGACDKILESRDHSEDQWNKIYLVNVGYHEASLSKKGQISRRSGTQMHFIRILRDSCFITSFSVDPVRLMSSILE